jgi:Holliday junction resolvase
VNAKAKGNRGEKKTMRLLEALGYRCCRSAASLGAFDVIAIGSADVLCVQVKSNSWPGSAEMEMLREFVVPPSVRKVVHRWRDRARLPDTKEIA